MRRIAFNCIGAAIAANAMFSGCAPAYHAYPNGCVTYGYRAASPPPFAFYRGCATPWLRRYASGGSSDVNASTPPRENSSRRL